MGPLAEGWDGTEWHIERATIPASNDGQFAAVSCNSTRRCVAVGSQLLPSKIYGTLAETWDGARWRVLMTPNPADSAYAKLLDVTCPRVNRCIAVGYSTSGSRPRPLVEAWDGKQWRIQPTTVPASFWSSSLGSIDCAAPASCRAVGTYQTRAPISHSFSADLTDGRWVVQPIRGT
jgi:hypothetical protein